MVELKVAFRRADEWTEWVQSLGNFKRERRELLADIRKHGLLEPFTLIRRTPDQIEVDPEALHESISSYRLNSRKRALLVQIAHDLRTLGWQSRRDLRILGAECLSRVALTLRGIFPYYLGTEYLPDPEDLAKQFPIPHLDLQDIGFPDNTFDMFVSGDVFEHNVPAGQQAIIFADGRAANAIAKVEDDKIDVIETSKQLGTEAETFLQRAKDSDDLRGGIAVISELRKQVALTAALLAQQSGKNDVVMPNNPAWLRIKAIIVRVLDRHADAKRDFLAEIGTLALENS